jgi:site-specific recombinase XerD
MEKNYVTVVYDRRKRVDVTGMGKVELHIYFNRRERKYICVNECNPIAWRKYQKSEELANEISLYEKIIQRMIEDGEELNVRNFNTHLGVSVSEQERKKSLKSYSSSQSFLDFMKDCISKEKISKATQTRKKVTIDAMMRYGKLNKFEDLTEKNVKGFDDFLRSECSRSSTTVHNYHKIVKKYTHMALQFRYITFDPYESSICHFERGKYKERRPLNEDELVLLRKIRLPRKEERVRDLFVFCAYTGLAYIDSQIFDFHTMTEKCNDFIYIDGKRVKTGNTYFTPILPPAMAILEKYDYKLPHITNQKANDYLHLIESRCKFNKPLTTHVARHSFATLCLSYDIPIENVARMMGHSDIKTTQVYAKILKSTIERHSETLASRLK